MAWANGAALRSARWKALCRRSAMPGRVQLRPKATSFAHGGHSGVGSCKAWTWLVKVAKSFQEELAMMKLMKKTLS